MMRRRHLSINLYFCGMFSLLSQERKQQYFELEAAEVRSLSQATHFSAAELEELRAILRSTAQQVSYIPSI